MTSIMHPAVERAQDPQMPPERRIQSLPLFLLALTIFATLLMGVLSPLRYLFLTQAFPNTPIGSWLLVPTRALLPGFSLMGTRLAHSPAVLVTAWMETALFFGSFCVLFLVYLAAVVSLARRVSYRFVFFSACILGLIYLIMPAIGSQDVFSYIINARAGIVYHLNPLTTVPAMLPNHDPILPHIYWRSQPSAYGPTWVAITSLLQEIVARFSLAPLIGMVFLLRLWGLAMLLASLQLIWSITGRQQWLHGTPSQRTRLLAALAFAWNPLLLFEGVADAHIDMTIVFFVLLALWFLQRPERLNWGTLALASVTLALAVCLKVNVALLFPGLVLFLWTQREQAALLRLQRVFLTTLLFVGTIFLLYAPFWQHGAVLTVFHINPSLTRDVNSPIDFFLRFYEGIRGRQLIRPDANIGSPPEIKSHLLSMVLFGLTYVAASAWFLFLPNRINRLSGLVGWMALVWLIYCIVGSPWFMPWYMLTFIGLIALLMGMSSTDEPMLGPLYLPTAMYTLSFSMLALYCFNSYAPSITGILHLSVGSFRELLDWLVLLAAIRFPTLRAELKQARAALLGLMPASSHSAAAKTTLK
jgi:hypothetical protein